MSCEIPLHRYMPQESGLKKEQQNAPRSFSHFVVACSKFRLFRCVPPCAVKTSRQKKRHINMNFLFRLALGQTRFFFSPFLHGKPGLSQRQTRFVPGTSPGSEGCRKSVCVKSLCVLFFCSLNLCCASRFCTGGRGAADSRSKQLSKGS